MALSKIPMFGYGGEAHARKGRPTIKRDRGGHEKWAEAILPADAEAGTIETPTSRRPLLLVVGLVVASGAILAAQLFQLQIVNGQRNLGLADGNRLRQQITRAERGIIYDRLGKPLAQNQGSFDITVIPSLLPQKDDQRHQQYAKVGELLGIPTEEVTAKTEGDCINSSVKAGKSAEQAKFECLRSVQPKLVASNVERDAYLNFDQYSSELLGFKLDDNPIRRYQDGGALSAIIGYTGRVSQADLEADTSGTYAPTDFIGKLGVEKSYEKILRGQNGTEQTEVDASGRPIKLLAAKPAKPGSNVVLSVDTELQQNLAESIRRQMQASGATQASGIAMNPKTGEVLAAVNLPTYDNNLFAGGISQSDYDRLLKDPAQPLFNKVTGGAYPVGSIIKPLIGAGALQERTINTNTTVNDTGQLEITNQYNRDIKYTFRSYEPGGLGPVNITRAIAVSSNVFFYSVGGGYGHVTGLGVNKLVDYYHKFGLGKKTGLDIPEETAGLVPTPDWKKKATGEGWFLGDTYNISVGQGDFRASPLQMAVAESAIANGGKVMKPRFVKEVKSPGGQTLQTMQPEVVRENFISPENLNVIRNAMRDVVAKPHGTACCRIEETVPVPVAAKTGTAETDPNGKKKPHAWFTAFAPFDDPQIEIVVLINNSGEGSQYAAPAVRDTLEWCFKRPKGCVQ